MKFIHLLYVPTLACNMQCSYCYLEDNTKDIDSGHDPLETLRFAVDKLRAADVMPFNISLHGGEVTTLSPEMFRDIISYIDDYYNVNRTLLNVAGFRVGTPHIKTNLFGLDRHIDTIREYQVSVSGSLDLPLSLHRKYRVTKDGRSTLDTILENTELMRELPNKKKVSATIFREHYEKTDEIIADIRYLHENTCLDMNDFNFMIGFDYNCGGLLHALTKEEQADFYRRIYAAFEGTELEQGLKTSWFAEFGPGYCTNCDNCGSKFFLLEKNGDIYSCVRGQKHEEFYYGNIYTDSVETILAAAETKIAEAHRRTGFNDACAKCGYLYLCKTGCPFVKNLYRDDQSYTCLLQQELYPMFGLGKDNWNAESVAAYVAGMHPDRSAEYASPRIPSGVPSLQEIIKKDPSLRYIYDPDSFVLKLDGHEHCLASQILKLSRETVFITPESEVVLYVRKEVMDACAPYPQNNALYIQALSGDMIVYGDEGRTKQRHVMNEMVYKGVLQEMPSDKEGFYRMDISHIFQRYGSAFSKTAANNIFFTTSALRDCHYSKQKNNAFYHMQAMDLPFQNIEFFYLTFDTEEDFV